MTCRITRKAFSAFGRREDGASLVEYAIVISLFLLVFFAILDFGRLGFNWVMTEKAMQRAVRIAVVRPPVCAGVPETQDRASSSVKFGSLCRAGGCLAPSPAVRQCVLSATDITPAQCATAGGNTAKEIWCILQPILPSNATPRSIRLTYSYDPNLGFAGGPYVPMVEVGVVTNADTGIANSVQLCFDFITPIPGLAALVGGAANINEAVCPNALTSIPFPDMSVSMPGEDLNQGNAG